MFVCLTAIDDSSSKLTQFLIYQCRCDQWRKPTQCCWSVQMLLHAWFIYRQKTDAGLKSLLRRPDQWFADGHWRFDLIPDVWKYTCHHIVGGGRTEWSCAHTLQVIMSAVKQQICPSFTRYIPSSHLYKACGPFQPCLWHQRRYYKPNSS